MILLYEKDPELAAGIARAFAARGQEVRRVEAFYDVRQRALDPRPAAVLFALDQNSLGAFGELRSALDPDVPVVAMGQRRFLYRAFVRLHSLAWMTGSLLEGRLVPERFWYVRAPVAAEAACDQVERAIREAATPVSRAITWRRRLVARAWLALLAAWVVTMIATFAETLLVRRPYDQVFAFRLFSMATLLILAFVLWERARVLLAALRVRLRPSWWSFTWLGLLALWVLGSLAVLVRAAFR